MLIDALFDKPEPAYRAPAPETLDGMLKGAHPYDGVDLVYQPDAAISALDSAVFAESLVEPAPLFVASFLLQIGNEGEVHDDGVKALYAYLLQKRYDERLNLLYFAFRIFDEDTRLPREIIEQTPLPHEDGVPSFGHFGQPIWVHSGSHRGLRPHIVKFSVIRHPLGLRSCVPLYGLSGACH